MKICKIKFGSESDGKTDVLNIRIESELKKIVYNTLSDLGMNIAEAVTIFLKQVVMTDSIPFIIRKLANKKIWFQNGTIFFCLLLDNNRQTCYNTINMLSRVRERTSSMILQQPAGARC